MDIDLRTFDRERLEVFFQVLIDALCRSTPVTGVTYRGTFYPAQTDLAGEIYYGRAPQPPELGYQVEELVIPEGRFGGHNLRMHRVRTPEPDETVNPGAIQYQFTPGLELNELDPDGIDPRKVPAMEATLAFLRSVTDIATTRILLARPLLLHRASGYNHDLRGADLLPFRLPQEQDILLPASFSLTELAEAIIRVKSHHFDWWYELFNEIKLVEGRNNYVLNIDFDFGS